MTIAEQVIDATTPEKEIYSRGVGVVGVGGFYVSLPGLKFPLFLSGNYKEWRQYEVGPGLYCFARLRSEILLVDTLTSSLLEVNFCFDDLRINDKQLEFFWDIDSTAKLTELLVVKQNERKFWIHGRTQEVVTVCDFKKLVVARL